MSKSTKKSLNKKDLLVPLVGSFVCGYTLHEYLYGNFNVFLTLWALMSVFCLFWVLTQADTQQAPNQPSATAKTPTVQQSNLISTAHVKLWNMAGVGLIIPHPSGITYSNQTGGYGCFHPSVEGVFVPLSTGGGTFQNTENTCPLAADLLKYFTGPKWHGHCSSGIDEETADYLDAQFQKYPQTQFLRVNRETLKESHEAWIHVNLYYPEERYPLFEGLPAKTAMLTWPNSD